MKSNKILVVLVVILIVINCVLLGLLWFNVYHVKGRPPIQGPAFDYLSRELNLTPTQKSQYEKMRDAHVQFADSLNTQTRMMKDSFFNYIKDPATKPEVINTLEKRISDNSIKLDTATFYHFRRFRAILTPNQQQKFDDVIQDVLHNMAGRPPQGGPPMGQRGSMPPNQPQAAMPNQPNRQGVKHTGPPQEGPPSGRPYGRDPHHFGPPQGVPPPDGRGPRPGMPPPDGPPPSGGRPEGPPPGGGPPQQ